jgi:hypothetical protein
MRAIYMEGGGWPPLLDGERFPESIAAAGRRALKAGGFMPKRLPLRWLQNRQSPPAPICSCLSFVILHLSFPFPASQTWSKPVKTNNCWSSADFLVCCVAGFQARAQNDVVRPADLEIGAVVLPTHTAALFAEAVERAAELAARRAIGRAAHRNRLWPGRQCLGRRRRRPHL